MKQQPEGGETFRERASKCLTRGEPKAAQVGSPAITCRETLNGKTGTSRAVLFFC